MLGGREKVAGGEVERKKGRKEEEGKGGRERWRRSSTSTRSKGECKSTLFRRNESRTLFSSSPPPGQLHQHTLIKQDNRAALLTTRRTSIINISRQHDRTLQHEIRSHKKDANANANFASFGSLVSVHQMGVGDSAGRRRGNASPRTRYESNNRRLFST